MTSPWESQQAMAEASASMAGILLLILKVEWHRAGSLLITSIVYTSQIKAFLTTDQFEFITFTSDCYYCYIFSVLLVQSRQCMAFCSPIIWSTALIYGHYLYHRVPQGFMFGPSVFIKISQKHPDRYTWQIISNAEKSPHYGIIVMRIKTWNMPKNNILIMGVLLVINVFFILQNFSCSVWIRAEGLYVDWGFTSAFEGQILIFCLLF